ncbi:MAG: hypothetical protein ACMXYF_05830 [Candidatus Woesearchaeota archaeon]
MNVRSYLYIVFIIFLSTAVFSQANFITAIEPVNNQIFSDEVAEFDLTITNFDIQSNRYTIYTTDPLWNLFYGSSVVRVDARETRTLRVIFDPSSSLAKGVRYTVPITVQAIGTDFRYTQNVDIVIHSDTARTFTPSIYTGISVGEDNVINPGRPFDVRLTFINRNALLIDPLEVTFRSPHFSESFSMVLEGREQIQQHFTYEIDSTTPEQNFSVEVILSANNISLGTVEKIPVRIRSYQPQFHRTVLTDQQQFLRYDYVVQLRNRGNVQSTEVVTIQTNFMERLFTQSNIPFQSQTIDGEGNIVFSITLDPGAGIELSIVRNYRPFVFSVATGVAIVVLILVLYYTFRSPIIITKRIETVSTDGAIKKIKVILDVKNRTKRHLEDVKIIERIPNITEIEKDFAVGTLRPAKIITHPHKGTVARWEFSSVDPYEERIITYTIKSKLSILGDLKLPPTVIKYETFGHTRTISEK